MIAYKQKAALIFATMITANLCGCNAENNVNSTTENLSSFENSTSSAFSKNVTANNYSLDNEDTSSEQTNDFKDTEKLIPSDCGELTLVCEDDITLDDNVKKSYGIDLFESAGGAIKFEQCSENELYDRLSTDKLSGKPADITLFDNGLAFPYACVNGIFQPIDDIVDLDSELWLDVKDFSEFFALNGWHYTAPAAVLPETLFYYSKSTIEDMGFEDPLQLYLQGEWDWNSFETMMRTFADPENEKYGISGDYAKAVFLSTGKTIVQFEEDTESFVTNLFDEKLAEAANYLYKLKNDGICGDSLLGVNGCIEGELLFFAGGNDVEYSQLYDISAVPPPSMPKNHDKYWQANISAFMWVSGSKNAQSVKLLLECSRKAGSQRMEKFSYLPTDCAVYDISGGISQRLSSDEQNEDFGKAVIPFIYSAPCEWGEWNSICGYFSDAVTVELSILNNKYSEKTYR